MPASAPQHQNDSPTSSLPSAPPKPLPNVEPNRPHPKAPLPSPQPSSPARPQVVRPTPPEVSAARRSTSYTAKPNIADFKEQIPSLLASLDKTQPQFDFMQKFLSNYLEALGKKIDAMKEFSAAGLGVSEVLKGFGFDYMNTDNSAEGVDVCQAASGVGSTQSLVHAVSEKEVVTQWEKTRNAYARLLEQCQSHASKRAQARSCKAHADELQDKIDAMQKKEKVDLMKMSSLQHDRDSETTKCIKFAQSAVSDFDKLKVVFLSSVLEEFTHYVEATRQHYADCTKFLEPLVEKSKQWMQNATNARAALETPAAAPEVEEVSVEETSGVSVSPVKFDDDSEPENGTTISKDSPVFQMFIQGEKRLVESLDVVLDSFLDSVMNDGSLFADISKNDVNAIFSGIRPLQELHTDFLNKLESSRNLVSAFDQEIVSRIYHVYTRYSTSVLISLDSLRGCRKNSKAFSNLITNVETKATHSQTLENLFLNPLQRINEYVVFLKDAGQQLELPQADCEYLERVRETLLEVDTLADNALGVYNLHDVLRLINGWEQGEGMQPESRRFLDRYAVNVPSSGSGELFILSDNLVYAKKRFNKKTFQFVHAFKLFMLTMKPLPDDPGRKITNAMEAIDFTDDTHITFCFESDTARQAAIGRVESCIQELDRNKVFAVPLDDLMHGKQQRGHMIPAILDDTTDALRTKFVGIEGIFRISASKNQLEDMRNRLDTGETFQYCNLVGHTVAGLLKLWLRELPEPICPSSLFDEFQSAVPMGTMANSPPDSVDSNIVQQLRSIISKMPDLNKRCLYCIIEMLAAVEAHQDTNKMTAANLSLIFSPLLMRQPGQESSSSSTSTMGLGSMNFECVSYMITRFKAVFSGFEHDFKTKKIDIIPLTAEEEVQYEAQFSAINAPPATFSDGSEASLSLRDIVMQGNLQKSREKRWDSRWVVIKRGWLYDFRSQRDTSCKMVRLQSITVSEIVDPTGKQKHCFVLRPLSAQPGKDIPEPIMFACKSPEEVTDWIQCISSCIVS